MLPSKTHITHKSIWKGKPHSILQLVQIKHKLKKQWQAHRSPDLRKNNWSIRSLNEALKDQKEQKLQRFLYGWLKVEENWTPHYGENVDGSQSPMGLNAILCLANYPKIWKLSEITMISKCGKTKRKLHPINLQCILSKLAKNKAILQYQFHFREKHGTIQQVHRIGSEIRSALEDRKYCLSFWMWPSAKCDTKVLK